jgi:hypothetical protein
LIDDLKEDSNTHMSDIRKSIQDLDEKFIELDEKFSKKIEILGGKKLMEILEMKNSINQIISVESIADRLD